MRGSLIAEWNGVKGVNVFKQRKERDREAERQRQRGGETETERLKREKKKFEGKKRGNGRTAEVDDRTGETRVKVKILYSLSTLSLIYSSVCLYLDCILHQVTRRETLWRKTYRQVDRRREEESERRNVYAVKLRSPREFFHTPIQSRYTYICIYLHRCRLYTSRLYTRVHAVLSLWRCDLFTHADYPLMCIVDQATMNEECSRDKPNWRRIDVKGLPRIPRRKRREKRRSTRRKKFRKRKLKRRERSHKISRREREREEGIVRLPVGWRLHEPNMNRRGSSDDTCKTSGVYTLGSNRCFSITCSLFLPSVLSSLSSFTLLSWPSLDDEFSVFASLPLSRTLLCRGTSPPTAPLRWKKDVSEDERKWRRDRNSPGFAWPESSWLEDDRKKHKRRERRWRRKELRKALLAWSPLRQRETETGDRVVGKFLSMVVSFRNLSFL